MKNISLKLLSLSIALLIWYQVTNSISTLTLKLPLEVANQPKDKILLSNVDNQISVKVKGPSFLINSLSSKLPVIRKSLPDDLNGRYLVNIKEEDIDLSNSLEVVSIEPSQVEYIFEKQVSKRVPVEVPRVGIPHQGFSVEEIKVEPEFIEIVGPLNEVKTIDSIQSFPVDVRQSKDNIETVLTVRKPSKFINLGLDQVKVLVKIAPMRMAKTFNDVGIKFLNNTKLNCELVTKLATITIMVSKPNLNKFTIDEFSPYVVLDNPDNLKNLEIKMDYPKGVFSASIEPSIVDVNCNKGKK